jgi:hypothetical protein
MDREAWLTDFIHELQRVRADIPRRDAHRAGVALYADGAAGPAAAAQLFAGDWDGWVTSFVDELQRLRPTMNAKLCKTIGVIRYAQGAHGEPKEAAHAYATRKQL